MLERRNLTPNFAWLADGGTTSRYRKEKGKPKKKKRNIAWYEPSARIESKRASRNSYIRKEEARIAEWGEAWKKERASSSVSKGGRNWGSRRRSPSDKPLLGGGKGEAE